MVEKMLGSLCFLCQTINAGIIVLYPSDYLDLFLERSQFNVECPDFREVNCCMC